MHGSGPLGARRPAAARRREDSAMWYTLIRFKDTPKDVTGVSQTKTAAEALALLRR